MLQTRNPTQKPNHVPRNKVQPTGPCRAAEVTRGQTKSAMLCTTYMNTGAVGRKVHCRAIHCVWVIKITLTRMLEPEKQRTASQTVETQNTSIISCHITDVERKVGTIGHSPGWIPHSLIPVRAMQIRVRWQTVLVK